MKHSITLALGLMAALCACQQVEMNDDFLNGSSSGTLNAAKKAETTAVDEGDNYSTTNFALSSDRLYNPEKGLYKHYEIFFDLQLHLQHPDWALDENGVSDLNSSSYNFNAFEGSLVLTLFYLVDYRTRDLDDIALNAIETTLQKVRNAGKKAIVRIAYSRVAGSGTRYDPSQPRDASLSQVQTHLNQLSSLFASYKDIIYLVQAGCIGTYGEWYYISQPEYEYNYTGSSLSSFSGRKDVLTALLNLVPGRQVAVRTPFFKRAYLNKKSDYQYGLNSYLTLTRPNADGDAHYRLAFYNDVFMCNTDDQQGTFPTSLDRNMWLSQSPFLACGGETANSGSTASYMMNVNSYNPVDLIKQYHMSYLHQRSNSDLYAYWVSQGKETAINNNLGYRLWVTSVKMDGTLSGGKTIKLTYSIKNNGAAPVIYKRPMKIVYIRNSDKKVTELASTTGSVSNYVFFSQNNTQTTQHGSTDYADIRKIAPNEYKYFTCQFTLPSTVSSGDMIAIWLPDQDNSLRGRKEYSIRLSNKQQGGFKWQNYADRSGTMAGFNTIYTF